MKVLIPVAIWIASFVLFWGIFMLLVSIVTQTIVPYFVKNENKSIDTGTFFGDFVIGFGTILGKIAVTAFIALGFALIAASLFTVYVCELLG